MNNKLHEVSEIMQQAKTFPARRVVLLLAWNIDGVAQLIQVLKG